MGSSPNLWYVGVLLEILSTMSGTIGKQLIRLSETMKRKNAHCSKLLFAGGLAINTIVGPIVDMAAYSFAAQSLIAPFGGLDVVWNALLAPFILQEKLTRRRFWGCALIILGTAMAGLTGNHEDSEYSLEYLEETLVNWRVLVYFVAFFAWFLVNRLVFMQNKPGSAIRGVSLGCTAGTIAGNMFCVKAAIELIQYSIHEWDGEVWLHWLPYTMLGGAVFFALTNVIYMTKGLQEFEALFMVTIYEGSMIVSGCVSGSIVLLDLKNLEAWRIVLYATSVLIIIVGMYVIFSQEVISRSSFLQNQASIKVEIPHSPCRTPTNGSMLEVASSLPSTGVEFIIDVRKEVQSRSFHASIDTTVPTGSTSPKFSSINPPTSQCSFFGPEPEELGQSGEAYEEQARGLFGPKTVSQEARAVTNVVAWNDGGNGIPNPATREVHVSQEAPPSLLHSWGNGTDTGKISIDQPQQNTYNHFWDYCSCCVGVSDDHRDESVVIVPPMTISTNGLR